MGRPTGFRGAPGVGGTLARPGRCSCGPSLFHMVERFRIVDHQAPQMLRPLSTMRANCWWCIAGQFR